MSRSAGRPVTEGETFERVCSEYLDRHDPERKEARLREKDGKAKSNGLSEGTPSKPGPERSRYVQAIEKREVLRAATGDVCRVAGCDNGIWLQNCHKVPFGRGGPNRAANLDRYCREHHVRFDSGELRAVESRGVLHVVDRAGSVIGRLRDPP